MKIISDSVDEDFPKFLVTGIVTFTLLFLKLGFNVEEPHISIVFGDQIGNFTRG